MLAAAGDNDMMLHGQVVLCQLRSPHSYVFQPENAMPIGTFIDEKDDVELLDILPILLELQNVREATGFGIPLKCFYSQVVHMHLRPVTRLEQMVRLLRHTVQVEDVRDHLTPKVAALHAKQRAAAAASANNSRRQL